MEIKNFDRLQVLVKEASDLIIKLKFENKSLKEKNTKLQEELNNGSQKSVQKLKRLEENNHNLRQRQEKITSRLTHLRNKVRSLTDGVES